jgi:predicted phosphodiesterase
MQVAILSDIHGNRHAFEAVLADAEAAGAEELWCLGDLVGYGAEPDACVELARRHAAICLAGNHDLGVTGEIGLDEFSTGAALAARWTQETITAANLQFLSALRPCGEESAIGLYHASPRDPVWEYVLSALLAELCFVRPEGDVATGEPRRDGDELDIGIGEWLLNPGSVGQPRDGDPRAAWLMLDLDRWRARWRRVEYDIAGAAAAIRSARLPDSLAERLGYGQ